MARRGEHSKEELSELILTASEALVRANGVGGLSARAIAKEIGYAPGTIYLIFANLDEVILQVNARTLDRMYAELEQAVAGRAKPINRIKRVAKAYVEFARQYPNLWGMCFEHRLPAGEELPEWFNQRLERLVSLIIDPIQEATGTSGRELETAAQALWGGVHGICILTLTNKLDIVGNQSTELLADNLITNYIAGLTAG